MADGTGSGKVTLRRAVLATTPTASNELQKKVVEDFERRHAEQEQRERNRHKRSAFSNFLRGLMLLAFVAACGYAFIAYRDGRFDFAAVPERVRQLLGINATSMEEKKIDADVDAAMKRTNKKRAGAINIEKGK